MKVEKRDGKREREVLIGQVVNDVVSARITSKWGEGNNYRSPWANIVGGWCVEHQKKHNEAPKRAIKSYFESFAETCHDETTVQLVEKFLTTLSDSYESSGEINANHTIDLAAKHFNTIKASRLADSIQDDLEAGRLDKAEEKITKYSKVEMGTGSSIHLFQNKEEVLSTFAREGSNNLFEYSGGLRRFMLNALEPGALLAFTGPQKSGKSTALVDLAWRAMLHRKRVGFFEIGDLEDWELKEFFLMRASNEPTRSDDGKWPFSVSYPTNIIPNKKGIADITTDEKIYAHPLNGKRAWEACQNVMQNKVKSKRSFFQMSCHPNLSITVDGIRSIIESWAIGGWLPEICVIDYADNLSPIDRKMDPRDRVNMNWQKMKALAQEFRMLVVTATQVGDVRTAFKKKRSQVLDRTNFSEDNRKLSHVNGLIGLNVTPEEKDICISRWNWIIKRKGRYNVGHCAHVAGCLAIANPTVRSFF